MLLTDEEKQRFIDWLILEADTDEKLVIQMKKIHTPHQVVEMYGEWAKACRVVAHILGHTEGDSIGG